jgi:hypothetical protein
LRAFQEKYYDPASTPKNNSVRNSKGDYASSQKSSFSTKSSRLYNKIEPIKPPNKSHDQNSAFNSFQKSNEEEPFEAIFKTKKEKKKVRDNYKTQPLP